jgi:hypothetical protein
MTKMIPHYVTFLCAILLIGCALFKSTAKTVIDVALATCIEDHPEIMSEPELAKVCEYTQEYGPIVRDLLSARKRGLARVAAQRVTLDAGVQDAAK